MEQITAFETSYLPTQTRNAQDTKLLYELIFNSITVEGQQKLSNYKREYILSISNPQVNYQAGVCLLKVLICESNLDSSATVSATRLKLSQLNKYVEENGSDITALNAYVKGLFAVLNSR